MKATGQIFLKISISKKPDTKIIYMILLYLHQVCAQFKLVYSNINQNSGHLWSGMYRELSIEIETVCVWNEMLFICVYTFVSIH